MAPKMIDRKKVIQTLIDKRGFQTYLEIGVFSGNVFFDVRCKRKIAVDPHFRFNWLGRLNRTARNPDNVGAKYFEVTSDEFFAKKSSDIFKNHNLDLALIDGMHEFDYVLNDVNNSLRYLSKNGVLVLHDCNPSTPEAETSYDIMIKTGYGGAWNGDTWKVIPYLLKHRPDLDVFVADCDHGLGIVTRKGETIQHVDAGRDEFRNMTYADLDRNRKGLLNLQPESYLAEFIAR
jgi:hypothetical protein